jgi:hypothetical protein
MAFHAAQYLSFGENEKRRVMKMMISLLKALAAARQSDGAAAVLMIIYGKTKILREYPTLQK